MRDAALRWLYDELPKLTAGGVLSEDAARRLREHYGPVEEVAGSRSLVTAVLGAIGASLIGAGVILLLAHNWDDISRGGRTALVVTVLVAAQAVAAFTLLRQPRSVGWRESSAALLTAAVGASQALVAQTYHLPGDWPGFLLAWAVLVLPLAYLLDSAVAAVAFWVLITMRAVGDGDAGTVSFWVLAAAGTPYLVALARRPGRCWRAASVLPIAALALCIGGVAICGYRDDWFEGLWLLYVAGLLAGLHAAAQNGPDAGVPWRRRLCFIAIVGLGTTAVFLTHVTLDGPARVDAAAWRDSAVAIALAIGAAGGLWALRNGIRALAARRWDAAVVGLAWPVMAAIWALGGWSPWAWWLANLYAAALGLAVLAVGLRAQELLPANLGLALLATLALSRFLDSELSFVARGLGFIAVGIGFLAMNLRLVRGRGRTR